MCVLVEMWQVACSIWPAERWILNGAAKRTLAAVHRTVVAWEMILPQGKLILFVAAAASVLASASAVRTLAKSSPNCYHATLTSEQSEAHRIASDEIGNDGPRRASIGSLCVRLCVAPTLCLWQHSVDAARVHYLSQFWLINYKIPCALNKLTIGEEIYVYINIENISCFKIHKIILVIFWWKLLFINSIINSEFK